MALSSKYIGSGTTYSSSYYMRNFYIANRDARTSSKRKEMTNSTLGMADGAALRRAIKQLGRSEFSEEKETDVRNAVKAYIETFNNALSSSSKSEDHILERNSKQLKNLAKEYASDLDKIGITVNDDGSLKCRDALFGSANISKFEKLFSGTSDFMQRTSACAKRIERRSEALMITEQNEKLLEIQKSKEENSTDTTAVAELFAEGTDLDTVLNTGIGQNVNVSV